MIRNFPGPTRSESVALTDCAGLPESVTAKVSATAPGAGALAGVPMITPLVASSSSPAGIAPPTSDHL